MKMPTSRTTTATRGLVTSRIRYRCTIIGQAVGWALLSWTLGGWDSIAASQSPLAREEAPIVIRADRAWEGADGEVLYLEGSFEMRSADWQVTAQNAEVHGPVEDPEQVIVTGQPARITFDNDGSRITGQGERIVYRHRDEVIELYDDAVLEGDDVSMSSSAIVYDLKNARLQSSGSDGIEVILRRDGNDG